MKEIRCPKCHEVFNVDQATYAEILSQVRNSEFENDLAEKIQSLNEKHKLELQQSISSIKDKFYEKIVEKDTELSRLKGIADNAEMSSKLAVKNATTEADNKIVELKGRC